MTATVNGHFDIADLKLAAQGRWQGDILPAFGFNPDELDGGHHPCPKCGGKDRYRMVNTAAELLREFTELRRPVIQDLLRIGETMNIISAPKCGKSWLVLGLVLSVATGRKWLNRFWTPRGRVLLIDNELHPETLSIRLPQVAESLRLTQADYDQNVSVVNLRGDLRDLVGLSTQLIGMKPGEFDLIVLDAWYRLQPSGSDENSNGDVTQLYNLLDSVASKIGCAFACVHHTSKGNQSGKSVTDVGSGAGAQARAPDTHLTMRAHEEDGAVVVEAAVRSWKPLEPFCMRWKFPAWSVADDLDPKDLRSDRPRKKSDTAESHATSSEEAPCLKEQAGRLKVLESYEAHLNGETESKLAAGAGMNTTRLAPFQVLLLREGLVERCQITKNNGGTYSGFKITAKGLAELRQLGQNTILSDLSDTTRTGAPPLGGTVCLWAFCDRSSDHWFLHGLFS